MNLIYKVIFFFNFLIVLEAVSRIEARIEICNLSFSFLKSCHNVYISQNLSHERFKIQSILLEI